MKTTRCQLTLKGLSIMVKRLVWVMRSAIGTLILQELEEDHGAVGHAINIDVDAHDEEGLNVIEKVSAYGFHFHTS